MTPTFTPARVPTILDVAAITGVELHIHPDDYLELLCTRGFTWPANSPRNLWKGTKLIEDDKAPMLPRKRL